MRTFSIEFINETVEGFSRLLDQYKTDLKVVERLSTDEFGLTKLSRTAAELVIQIKKKITLLECEIDRLETYRAKHHQ